MRVWLALTACTMVWVSGALSSWSEALPGVLGGAVRSVQAGPVTVQAGDNGVSTDTLRRIAESAQSISAVLLPPGLGAAVRVPSARPRLVLYSDPKGYAAAAQVAFPRSELTTVMSQTAGFTDGLTVVIPLYKYTDPSYLTNTLAHELTHAALNAAGIGPRLPAWVNEGYAWYNGLAAQSRVNPASAAKLQSELWHEVSTAVADGAFQPVAANPDASLTAREYNVEFADFLAVRDVIRAGGMARFDRFLAGVPQLGANGSFQREYGETLEQFAERWQPAGRPAETG
ncbi:MAG: hypothetical protein IRZ33_04285 [Alicyclobacillaceae bacterium]|nr:hypothetical protein [Alicyclobacillaceae bacterium]